MAFKFLDVNLGSSLNLLGTAPNEQFKVDRCLAVKKKKKTNVIHLYKAKIPVATVEAYFQVINSHGNLPVGEGQFVVNTPDEGLKIWNVEALTGLVTLDVDSYGIPTAQPATETVTEFAVTDLFIEPTPL